jgi:hypothetical protein
MSSLLLVIVKESSSYIFVIIFFSGESSLFNKLTHIMWDNVKFSKIRFERNNFFFQLSIATRIILNYIFPIQKKNFTILYVFLKIKLKHRSGLVYA